jgi:hypothetical protein
MAEELDFDARYSVSSMSGVAFYLVGYLKEYPNPDDLWLLVCEDDDCMHDTELCYVYDEDPEPIENRDFVLAVMVGDDREFTVEVSELTKISDDDYCPGCGQIGCKAYGDYNE